MIWGNSWVIPPVCPVAMKLCPKCGAQMSETGIKEKRLRCNPCIRDKYKNSSFEDSVSRKLANMLKKAKRRSAEKNLPFNLTKSDLEGLFVMKCPVLGLGLDWRAGRMGGGGLYDNTPSLDRICPEKGYVVGNLQIISYRANQLKNNATLAEIRAIAEWMERHATMV